MRGFALAVLIELSGGHTPGVCGFFVAGVLRAREALWEGVGAVGETSRGARERRRGAGTEGFDFTTRCRSARSCERARFEFSAGVRREACQGARRPDALLVDDADAAADIRDAEGGGLLRRGRLPLRRRPPAARSRSRRAAARGHQLARTSRPRKNLRGQGPLLLEFLLRQVEAEDERVARAEVVGPSPRAPLRIAVGPDASAAAESGGTRGRMATSSA